MNGGPVSSSAAALRAYALAVIAQDAAYDRNPQGDPVLLTSDMRRGLHAALSVEPAPLFTAGPAVTAGEQAAFRCGMQAALDMVYSAVAVALGPERLRHRQRFVRRRSARRSSPSCAAVHLPVATDAIRGAEVGDTKEPGTLVDLESLLLLDGDGRLLVPFGHTTSWAVCHAWAHAQAIRPGVRLPVQIDDPRNRQTWRITPTACSHAVWLPGEPTSRFCPLTSDPGPRE